MRALFVVFLLVLSGNPAHAAEARKYAVLSLVGDRLMLVQRVPPTETRCSCSRTCSGASSRA